MPVLGNIVGVDKLDRGDEELSGLWKGSGVCLDNGDGPRTDTVGDRAAGEWSGHDHRPGADIAAEELPSRSSSHICPINGDQKRESHSDLERTSNRDPRMSGRQTRAQRGSTQATATSTFNSCIFQHSHSWTNLAHKRTDEPPPGHPDQTKVPKGIPRTNHNRLSAHPGRSRARRAGGSPDRAGDAGEDRELALDEGEQAEEAEVAPELGPVAEVLEARVVRRGDAAAALRAFCIGGARDRRARRAVPRR